MLYIGYDYCDVCLIIIIFSRSMKLHRTMRSQRQYHTWKIIDGDIESGDTMAKLPQRKKLAEFIQKHTSTRHYSFSIKKCGIDLCMVFFEPRDREMLECVRFLPDPMPSEDPDHYMPYQVSSIRVLRPQISGSSFHYVNKPFFICNCHWLCSILGQSIWLMIAAKTKILSDTAFPSRFMFRTHFIEKSNALSSQSLRNLSMQQSLLLELKK